jgi:hypothetical protein
MGSRSLRKAGFTAANRGHSLRLIMSDDAEDKALGYSPRDFYFAPKSHPELRGPTLATVKLCL